MFALSKSISFLGQLWFQSTDLDEGTNKFHRRCIRNTNNKATSSGILKNVAAQRSGERQVFRSAEDEREFKELKSVHVRQKRERKFLEGTHPKSKEMNNGEIKQVRDTLNGISNSNITYTLESKLRTIYE
jgi:hypothetical protein